MEVISTLSERYTSSSLGLFQGSFNESTISICKLCQACFLKLSYLQHYSDKIRQTVTIAGAPLRTNLKRQQAQGSSPSLVSGSHTPQLVHLSPLCACLCQHALSGAERFHLVPLRDCSTAQSGDPAALQSSPVLHLMPQ